MVRNLASLRERVLSEDLLHDTDIAFRGLKKKGLEKMLFITVWVMIPRNSLVTGS